MQEKKKIQINLKKMKMLMKFNELQLKEYLYKELKKYYKRIICNEKYLIAAGEGEVCLLAHMDTVFRTPPTFFFHDQNQHILWSPEGMGADDRAGIYAILEILQMGARPHIIFTTGEEMGGIGASKLIADYPTKDYILPDLKFLIQLDRRGSKDSVYYECDNPIFEEWINSFGFETSIGTYTDISIIAPKWKVAAVNLSIGYYNEHQEIEMLFYNYTVETILKVFNIIEKCNSEYGPKDASYIPRKCSYSYCPICQINKITKNSPNVSSYNLGINLICQQCYDEYFKC